MIMFFSIIFTAIILTSNHLYSTFASPMVSKRGVPADQSLNLTHSLAKRNDYWPPNQLCELEEDWIARRCLGSVSDRTWQDVCLSFTNDGRHIYIEVILGSCGENELCFNKVMESDDPSDTLPIHTSECIPRPGRGTVVATNPDGDPEQTGVLEVMGRGVGAGPSQVLSILIVTPLSKASVSAFIEGTYGISSFT